MAVSKINPNNPHIDVSVSVYISGIGMGYSVIQYPTLPDGFKVDSASIHGFNVGADATMYATNIRDTNLVLGWYSQMSSARTSTGTVRLHLVKEN